MKEGSDASRFSVSTTVTATSIAYLGSRAKPSSYPTNNRIAPYELKTWQLRAYLTQYKMESDGDLHLGRVSLLVGVTCGIVGACHVIRY